ncbi:MAG: pyridoxamine 5'-phosphate oxidase family protein [Chloroflexi bacterium]|nr:pyridoxamine 5'-phosphate oxidase family protein [Chloroflexota bacterium]MDA0245064.1 pyridoxamine 5'-phosphate oxidase family protein [Chloroflexota bacterium]
MRRRNVERWRTIEARLGREATIWLVTVRPDDNPQMFPTWFVWLENKLYFVVATNSQQFENLRHNQGVSLALTDAERGVVIEGQAHASDRKAIAILADYFYNKYEFDFSQDKEIQWRLVEVVPQQILAWGDGYDEEGMVVFENRETGD